MTDLEQRIFNFAKKHQLVNFTTVAEDNKPRARYVVGNIDESMFFRFSTHTDSNKARQIANNPNVFLTMGAHSMLDRTWLQIEGTATLTRKANERYTFWFHALKQYYRSMDDPRYSIVIVNPVIIQLCTLGTSRETWQRYKNNSLNQ
jgi:general stress protein 26